MIVSAKKVASSKEVVISDFKNVLEDLFHLLHQKNIQSLIVEGGSKTLQHFIDANLWDEARIFKSPNTLSEGIKNPSLEGVLKQKISIEGDQLEIIIPN